jgi:putative ABC transport system permease protein
VRPETYLPARQDPWPFAVFVVRTQADPMALAEPARRAILEVDENQPISRLRPMSDFLAESVAQRRFVMLLIGLFAGLAALLAALGLYGVIAYSVHQRTHEIGVRMALGARSSSVRGMVTRQGLILAGLGLAIGIPGVIGVAKMVGSVMSGLGTVEPMAVVVMASVLAVVTLLASWMPARRAAAIDPIVALRGE